MNDITPLDSQRFYTEGFTVLPEIVPRETARLWAETAIREAKSAYRRDRDGEGSSWDQIDRHHFVLDTGQVQSLLPDLWAFYRDELREITERVVGREVILSPYFRSAVNVKVYAPNDDHGWHYDTNALTALLYLTETDRKTGTLVEPLVGAIRPVLAQPGDMLVMQGRKVNHKVRPVPADYPTRVTVPLNLYYPGDTDRPAGMDEVVYGSA